MFDARAIIVLILATSLGATIFATVLGAIIRDRSLTGPGIEALSFLGGALVTLIANYVTGQRSPPPAGPDDGTPGAEK